MSRWHVAALTFVAAAIAAVAPRAQSPPLTAVMQEKAQNAQGLLIPLVLGDFAGIERYATRLGQLTYTEVASWQASPSVEYHQQATAFLQAIEELGQSASAHDVDRASIAYADLVASCVNCHQQVKTRRSVLLTPPAPFLEAPVPQGLRR